MLTSIRTGVVKNVWVEGLWTEFDDTKGLHIALPYGQLTIQGQREIHNRDLVAMLFCEGDFVHATVYPREIVSE